MPSCQLLDLVIDLDWERVLHHVTHHPQDASFQDGDGLESPLYLACQYSAPAHVVSALLHAYPQAATTTCCAKREIPLYTACLFGATVDVLRALLTATETRTTTTAQSPSLPPLCHTVMMETRWGKTPIMALLEGTRNRRLRRRRSNTINDNSTTLHPTAGFNSNNEQVDNDDDSDDDDQLLWPKIKVILEAVARSQNLIIRANPQPDHDTDASALLLVHAAIALGPAKCPSEAWDLTLRRCQHQLCQQDELGRTPLHMVVLRQRYGHHPNHRCHLSMPRNVPTSHPDHHAIVSLLHYCPEAAKIPWNGRYPLDMAVSNGHAWQYGVKELFQAHPDAASVADGCTLAKTDSLLPLFVVAAVASNENDINDNNNDNNSAVSLDTIYNLLLAQPHVLEQVRTTKSSTQIQGDHNQPHCSSNNSKAAATRQYHHDCTPSLTANTIVTTTLLTTTAAAAAAIVVVVVAAITTPFKAKSS